MDRKFTIIGFVGEKGAGKGTVVEYLHEKYKAPQFTYSTILNDILKRLYVPLLRKNQSDLFRALKELYGKDILAHTMKRDIEKGGKRLNIIEGVRRWEDIDTFRKGHHFYLVAISADVRVRYERLKNRGEKANEKNMTFKQFLDEETLPTEIEIQEISSKADFKLMNNGTVHELYKQIDEVMKQILPKEHIAVK